MLTTTRTDRSPSRAWRRSLLAGLLGAGVLFATFAPSSALAATPATSGGYLPPSPINPQQVTQVYQNPASTRMLNPQPLPPKVFGIPSFGR